ncbi:MAG: hypothetical protein JXQ29_07195 [Planctomycetes bacterium]|nr:hypothetical protein [Planctomycetota bacterium]
MYRTGLHLRTALVALLVVAFVLPVACSRDVQTEPREAEPLASPETGQSPAIPETRAPQESWPGEAAPAGPQEGELEQRYRLEREQRQFQAARLVEEGRDHFLRGENEKALSVLSQARYLDKDNTEAVELLNRVAAALDQREGAIQDQAHREHLKRRAALEQAQIRADSLVKQGDSAVLDGDFARAIDAYEEALNLVQFGPYGLEVRTDQAAIENRLRDARERLKRQEQDLAHKASQDLLARKTRDEAAEAQRNKERIQRLLGDADRAFQQSRFDDAEKFLGFVLKLADPESDKAEAIEAGRLTQIVRESRHNLTESQNRRRMAEEWKRVFEDLRASNLLPTEVIEFPDDWLRMVGTRKPATIARMARVETEEDKIVGRRLDSIVVNLSIEDETRFAAVIDYFHRISNVNFVISKAVHEKLAEGATLTAINTKLPLRNALALVLDMAGGLKYRIEDGLVRIIMPEEARADTYLDFYPVQDLVNPIKDFPGIEINLNPSGAEAMDEGFGAEPTATQSFEPDRLVDLIKGNIAKPTWDEDPAAYSATHRQGILIVKHTQEVHRQIQQALDGLRKSANVMVALEARFLLVEDNFLEDIGVDFRGLGDDSQGIGLPGRGTSANIDDTGAPGSPGGVGTPENPAGPGTSSRAGIFYNNNSDGDIRARTENLYDSLLGNPAVLTGSGGLSLQYTFLDDAEVELILRAVRKSERINQVTAPRITVFNTQRANVTVLNQVAYIKDFDAEIAQAAAIVEPVVDVIQDGVVLDVRPIVSADRRFITMDLRPTVAQLTRPIPQFTASVATGTPVTLELPRLEVQRVRTTVTIPDNATVLLGGLKFSEEQNKYSGIPLLSKLPLVGFLTSRRGKYINRRNLLILLKAQIIIPDEIAPKPLLGT